MRQGVWNLRSQRCFGPIGAALRAVRRRVGFRVVHFSVQGNHMHLVTEADDRRAMTQGLRGLLIRIAKRLNRVMRSRGRVFADRFHERVLRTPTETRNVLRYVLGNHARHMAQVGKIGFACDPFSSALVKDAVCAATSWLLTHGWSRARDAPIATLTAGPLRRHPARD